MTSFHGKVILTLGLITTPRPTRAPKQRSTQHLSAESLSGKSWNNPRPTSSHKNSRTAPAPRSKSGVEKADSFTFASERSDSITDPIINQLHILHDDERPFMRARPVQFSK